MTNVSAPGSASISFVTSTSAGQSSVENPAPAAWLADIQRRLANSVGAPTPSGAWLPGDVVTSANSLFLATSDLLPSEPSLHASFNGELIAEFSGDTGAMTLIVTRGAALAVAIINGQPLQNRFSLAGVQSAVLRAEVSKVTDAVRMAAHGPVAAAR